MRIVGGAFKGRTLKAPKSDAVRPTTDRMRESLFNMLAHDPDVTLEGARVIDLFAGTGALGFEALSRGADFVLFVDNSLEGRALIRQNIETLGTAVRSRLFKRDATKIGQRGSMPPFDLVFLDPPYGKGLGDKALQALHAGEWLTPNALLILEEAVSAPFMSPAGFTLEREKTGGDTLLRFLRYDGGGASGDG